MEFKISANNAIGLFLLITIIVMEVKVSLQQHCRPKITSQQGYALATTPYQAFTTQDYPTCAMECKKDERCMSHNFNLVTKACELNTRTKENVLDYYYEKRPNSIYTASTAFRTPEPAGIGLAKNTPGKSCLEILNKNNSVGTGVYWIDPANTGTPILVYCDMTTDGGGWTIVKKNILQTTTKFDGWTSAFDLNVIAMHDMNSKWVEPKVQAMMDIKNKMGFQQIHFYCHKKSVGRVVSIMNKKNTAGKAVVSFFTGPLVATVFPTACGSFDRLPEDTSVLSQNCARWGTAIPIGQTSPPFVDKWSYGGWHGPGRFGSVPFCMNLASTTHFYGSGNYGSDSYGTRYLCDDGISSPEPYTAGDIWQISVR